MFAFFFSQSSNFLQLRQHLSREAMPDHPAVPVGKGRSSRGTWE